VLRLLHHHRLHRRNLLLLLEDLGTEGRDCIVILHLYLWLLHLLLKG